MESTWTWEQVISGIKGVANRGAVSKTFTPSGSEQSYTVAKGYHNGSGTVKCKAVSLTGDASTGHVLKDKTFYKNSLTKLTGTLEFTGDATAANVLKDKTFYSNSTTKRTGTMPSKTSGSTSVTASGKWGLDTTNGAWLYIPTNAYYSTSHWLNIPWNTIKSKVQSMGLQYKSGAFHMKDSFGEPDLNGYIQPYEGQSGVTATVNCGFKPDMVFLFTLYDCNSIHDHPDIAQIPMNNIPVMEGGGLYMGKGNPFSPSRAYSLIWFGGKMFWNRIFVTDTGFFTAGEVSWMEDRDYKYLAVKFPT